MSELNIKYWLNNMMTLVKKSLILVLIAILPQNSLAQGLSPYSNKELEQLEKEFIQLINQADSVERHPLAIQYINELGKNLARFSQTKPPYFFIVKSKEINAFAGPGGYIGINTQLILTTTNESELAAVMAHEIAHVRLHHLYSSMEHQKQMRVPMMAALLASAALGAINPSMGMGAMMASMGGFSQDNINYIRSKEKEADRIGIDMLMKAGFNTKGMATFFRKMQENSRYYYTANIPAILRTHPLDDDRIAEAENRIARMKANNHADTMDYGFFKELLRTSVSTDNNQLLTFYAHQCNKQNTPLACQYGQVLTLLHSNRFQETYNKLTPLLNEQPTNLHLQIAMAEAELGLLKHDDALKRLSELQSNYPEHYAILLAYAQGLLATNQHSKAISLLLKANRVYKNDLTICRTLARAQAKAGQKSYAYFTQSQCLIMEGQKRAAIAQLQVAKTLAKGDAYLLARISAKIDEIKFLTED